MCIRDRARGARRYRRGGRAAARTCRPRAGAARAHNARPRAPGRVHPARPRRPVDPRDRARDRRAGEHVVLASVARAARLRSRSQEAARRCAMSELPDDIAALLAADREIPPAPAGVPERVALRLERTNRARRLRSAALVMAPLAAAALLTLYVWARGTARPHVQ